jgi:hypothetical protein
MPGPRPKEHRQRPRDEKRRARGTWQSSEAIGWQHGRIPPAPTGLMPYSREAWRTWFRAWFAAHWGPEDLPNLRVLVRLFDQVERGEYQRAGELRLWMSNYGISPAGQQERRWKPPEQPATAAPSKRPSKYGKLHAVEDLP